MEKRVFVVLTIVFSAVFYGCSMMPNDEEIIRGAVNESEIFEMDEGMFDVENNEDFYLKEELDDSIGEGIDENNIEDENEEENLGLDNDVVVDVM